MKMIIDVGRDGTARWIHKDEARGLLELGPASIARASHVEPGDPARGQDPLRWYADLSPVGGPTLGPYDERTQALGDEVQWLTCYHLGDGKTVPAWEELAGHGCRHETVDEPRARGYNVFWHGDDGSDHLILDPTGAWCASDTGRFTVAGLGIRPDLEARRLAARAVGLWGTRPAAA